MRNVHKILIAKTEGNRSVRGLRRKWEDTIKMYLKGIGWRAWTKFVIGASACMSELRIKLSGSMKVGDSSTSWTTTISSRKNQFRGVSYDDSQYDFDFLLPVSCDQQWLKITD
jgi:hypothetical protein